MSEIPGRMPDERVRDRGNAVGDRRASPASRADIIYSRLLEALSAAGPEESETGDVIEDAGGSCVGLSGAVMLNRILVSPADVRETDERL